MEVNVITRIRDHRIRARGARFYVRPAVEADLDAVIRLIDEAGHWLKTSKNTDQWNRPWPDRDSRDKRVYDGISGGLTWVVMDGATMAATVTIATVGDTALWTDEAQAFDAVYVHRLVIDRRYAGTGLGAELIDWAGEQGRREQPAATSIRIDVWTTNEGLHAYYRDQGFLPCGVADTKDDRPANALFEKQLPDSPPATPRLTTRPQPSLLLARVHAAAAASASGQSHGGAGSRAWLPTASPLLGLVMFAWWYDQFPL